jgi:hypothetical protein
MYGGRYGFEIGIAAILVHCIIGDSYGQDLVAKLANATLPSGLYYSTAVYDGSDSVYIFGG